jgi:uncharacterized protein YyaL (SSP411 family)
MASSDRARKDIDKRLVSNALLSFILCSVVVPVSFAQKSVWSERLLATNTFLQTHMWNAATGNFVRRSDQPQAAGSDAWGITIMLDAYAYMVETGFMKPEALKQYYNSSTSLYSRTGGTSGARILAQQGQQIYIGGDDDLQWSAALAHCYAATHDSEYLNAAISAFTALVEQGFWIEHGEKGARGWAWNSADMRPNGVSTAYGALAAARLFQATGTYVYKWWASAALVALKTPQVGYFPRDMMVAANAAITLYEVSKQKEFLKFAEATAKTADRDAAQILEGRMKGEINPTDIGDLAEGFARLYAVTGTAKYLSLSKQYLALFTTGRNAEDIAEHGFYSRYTSNGQPVTNGAYLGVPLTAQFLPENAEMLKLFAVAFRYF